jgi:hypothetical protein
MAGEPRRDQIVIVAASPWRRSRTGSGAVSRSKGGHHGLERPLANHSKEEQLQTKKCLNFIFTRFLLPKKERIAFDFYFFIPFLSFLKYNYHKINFYFRSFSIG